MPALLQDVPARYYIRLNSGAAESTTDHALILDQILGQAHSEAAVFYEFQPEIAEFNAITVRSHVTARVKNVGVTLSSANTRWLESLPGLAQGRPVEDVKFEKFPEVLQYHLRRLALIPLRSEDDLFGLLTLGRTAETEFDSQALGIAERAGRLLTAVLERNALHQRLIERKLVERAKGILQQRRRLSEEQAYHLLRNNSRRRRMPMVDLANEVIQTYVRTSPARPWQAGLNPAGHEVRP